MPPKSRHQSMVNELHWKKSWIVKHLEQKNSKLKPCKMKHSNPCSFQTRLPDWCEFLWKSMTPSWLPDFSRIWQPSLSFSRLAFSNWRRGLLEIPAYTNGRLVNAGKHCSYCQYSFWNRYVEICPEVHSL